MGWDSGRDKFVQICKYHYSLQMAAKVEVLSLAAKPQGPFKIPMRVSFFKFPAEPMKEELAIW